MKNSKITPLPWFVYFVPVLLLGIAGLGDSVYLAISHYRNYTDIEYSSFCALSRAINCDTVSQSPWSIMFGLPVALWGVFGYLLLLIFIIHARHKSLERLPFWSLIALLSFLYSLGSIYFGYVSAMKIKAYCIMCILSYGINFSLLFYCFIIVRRYCDFSFNDGLRQSIKAILESSILKAGVAFWAIILLILHFLLPHYWLYEQQEDMSHIESGLTEEGHPWIGAANPKLTIEEFTDYQCFQCRKMHYYLRHLVERNSDKLRLVHHHFPLDKEFNAAIIKDDFHIGSGRLALLAIAVSFQGAFWDVNDALYDAASRKKTVINVTDLAQELGLDIDKLQKDIVSRQTVTTLMKDINTGLQHNITGTPTYVINGDVFPGIIPAEILDIE